MTTVYDVPPDMLIRKVAGKLRDEKKIEPPEWSKFVKTGVHRQSAPVQKDWWYDRVAAVLRKIYIEGPIGVSRLSSKFGGKTDRGSKPYHARKGSRSIARSSLKQLEENGLVTTERNRGRIVTPKGQSFLDNTAHEIMTEMVKSNPSLSKYYLKTSKE